MRHLQVSIEPVAYFRELERRGSSAEGVESMSSANLGPVDELDAFAKSNLWPGGYLEADPLLPVSWNSYHSVGFVSIWHAAYLTAVRPFVDSNTVALEIGPGRGAWTKAILSRGAKRVYALDVQDREVSQIDAYLGPLAARLEFVQVTDFSCSAVPDDSCTFFWSAGCFVHLSPDAQKSYFENIFVKLKPGSNGFVQIADPDSWNKVVTDRSLRIDLLIEVVARRTNPKASLASVSALPNIKPRTPIDPSYKSNTSIRPGRFFFVGLEETCDHLRKVGFQIVDKSAVPSLRDPLVHFRKP